MLARLAHVLYFVSCVIALSFIVDFLWGVLWCNFPACLAAHMEDWDAAEWLRSGGLAIGLALGIWLIGRAVLYVLADE